MILTNPPFGATYSGDDLASFEMAAGRNRVDSELLFLERYTDWVKPGGIIVTIVPDSVLVNRNQFSLLRSLIRQRCSIEAVISLPPSTFGAAGTYTKTSILMLRRTIAPVTVDTYFAEAKEIGYDVITRSGQRRRIHHGRSDLPALLEELKCANSIAIGKRCPLPDSAERWDANFQVNSEAESESHGSDASRMVIVSDIAALVDDRCNPQRRKTGEFSYIEISDVDGRRNLVGSKRLLVTEAPVRARKVVRAGDVLFSTVRPERGDSRGCPSESRWSHLLDRLCSPSMPKHPSNSTRMVAEKRVRSASSIAS